MQSIADAIAVPLNLLKRTSTDLVFAVLGPESCYFLFERLVRVILEPSASPSWHRQSLDTANCFSDTRPVPRGADPTDSKF